MAIPDFQSLLLPLLQFASDGKEHSLQEAREHLAKQLGLTDEERKELLPSARQPVFDNRVAWAKSYLQQSGLVISPRRAHFRISERGCQVLAENPPRMDIKFLERFPEFVAFRTPRRDRVSTAATERAEATEQLTPEESLDAAYEKIRSDLAIALLDRVKGSSPQFFEKLVVELLLKMGYGGSMKEAGEAIGRAGDEGIDGIIREDRLGFDVIYLQAKKWEGTVGRPEVQKFVGALHGKKAKKGVFITTGNFSADATNYASNIDPKVVLIDGRQLAEYMIDFGLGVTLVDSYEIRRIDSDYFSEE